MKKRKNYDKVQTLESRDYQIYRLKITIAHVHPPLWRRLEVDSSIMMDSLASAIGSVFGWSGDHMGEFDLKGRRIGDGTDWFLDDPHAAEREFRQLSKLVRNPLGDAQQAKSAFELLLSLKTKLQTNAVPAADVGEPDLPTLRVLVPRARTKFRYIYDFGDNWEHVLEVEKILAPEPGVAYPRCTGGARANPLEDRGGVWGYQELVEAAGNPKHDRYAELKEWGMEKWDPEHFSLEEADQKLARLFQRKQ
jgi:hypothetical protein